ncbi:MAG: hypothetical protein GEV10_21970 [Streptosporangiales bacterium]|nr:hypothetical protein [Streptosporangiales bacterium]
MNRRLAVLAAGHGGAFTTTEAATCGYSTDAVRAFVRDGTWLRLRRATYTDRVAYLALDALDRHIVDIQAALLAFGRRVVVSHTSAVVLHDTATWAPDLSLVHLTRVDGGSPRICHGVQHHVGDLRDQEITQVCGIPVVVPERAIVEAAGLCSFEQAVVMADHALHTGLVTRERLRAQVEAGRDWPGSRNTGAAVGFSDGRSESVGESRARVLMYEEGLPEPELQKEIRDGRGRLVGRVDFFFPDHDTVIEFDGRVKYQGSGPDASDAVVREKRREDDIRETGKEVGRLDWGDLGHPAATAVRIRAAFARARRRR